MRSLLIIFLLLSFIDLQAIEDRRSEPKIALVLSGGGARGFSQVGVLKVLEKYNIEPDYIVGTSIGAIIGAAYASGYSANDLDSIMKATNWVELFSLNDPNDRDDLFRDQKLIEDRSLLRLRLNDFKFELPQAVSQGSQIDLFLQDLFWNADVQCWGDFDKLKYPFRAVATDLVSGSSVSLKEGNLSLAVRASSTIPLRYTPVRLDSMILVDGGIKGNLPVLAADEFKPDIIIAVNATSPLLETEELDLPWKIADQVVTILIEENVQDNEHLADVLIKPDLQDIKNDDFSDPGKMIKRGEIETEKHIQSILNKIVNWDKGVPKILDTEAEGRIGSVQIKGSKAPFLDELLYMLNSNFIGKEFNDNVQRKLKDVISEFYLKKDYSFFNISEVTKQKGLITITVNEGLIHKINIKDPINNFLILRDLTFTEGDKLKGSDLSDSYQNLISNGYFKDVNFELVKDSLDNIHVGISATELPSRNLLLGLNSNNERNTQASLELINNNLFGFGNRSLLRVSAGSRDATASISFENPRIASTYLSLNANFYYKYRDVYTYAIDPEQTTRTRYRRVVDQELREDRLGMTFGGGFQLAKLGDLKVIYKYEKQRSYFYSDAVPEYYTLSTIKIESVFDTEDDNYFPTKGYFANTFFESNLFSDPIAGFSKWFFDYRYNYLIGRSTLTPQFTFGFADITLPRPELFNFGGQYSFFGYREFEGRGRQILRGSLNYRVKSPVDILFDTYLSLRYDVGSVWDQPEEIKPQNLRHGLGLTLALDTPLGSADFSIGRSFYFVDEATNTISGPFLLYFNIGSEF